VRDLNDIMIRPATENDVDAVKDLFVTVYGEEYPFTQFYDTSWLKKAVFDDDTFFWVAEDAGRIVGTISVLLTAGNLSDLIGEFGRLVVDSEVRGKNIGTRLFETAIESVLPMIQFGFAEARTAHIGSQKILERCGFVPVGFEPLKYKLRDRESVAIYGRLFGRNLDLRRNHPRVIPEVAPLAMRVLKNIGLGSDVVVVEEDDGYPAADELDSPSMQKDFEIEDLSEQGWSPLLRIERGRVKGREVFGNLSLAHGFFKIKTQSTRYLVARQNGAVAGGLGFTHDPIDQKVRIFELIGIHDLVKGKLLRRVEQIAREDLNVIYIDADVNAYTPAIQRTLERMGFMAVAYCPSMVFEEVERLDVIRMAKLTVPYYREEIPLTERAEQVREFIERSLEDRREGGLVAQAAQATELFQHLDEGDIYHLAQLGSLRTLAEGEYLIRQGDTGDQIYIILSGTMQVLIDGNEVGRVGTGETVGEMALLKAETRVADVIALEAVQVVEIQCSDLMRLMNNRPRLGSIVMRNLAGDLSEKLRKIDVRFSESERGK
jgi:N-acetylglutamate synthase-like GNAT family acetyltransferase